MDDECERAIFRVKSINPGSDAKQTTWVRATSSWEAENHVREIYSRHYVESAVELDSPDDAEVIDAQ